MIRLIPLFLFVLCTLSGSSQENAEKIQWKANSPLSWSDFRAEPVITSPFSANTNSGISYSWNYSTATGATEFFYEVFSNFYPNLSWVKDIENKEYLLAHEQLHFDISELHARKLRKALQQYQIGRNIRLDLKRIYNRVEAARVKMQQEFDKETSHSENRTAELRWRKLVATELQKYSDYAR